MTEWFWKQVGGTLIEEFCAVPRGPGGGGRWIDGIIVKDGESRRARQAELDIVGRDIIIVQAKAMRLGMSLMGQAFFSVELMKRFKPRSIESVALVSKDDAVLRPIFESYPGMRVVVCPASVSR
jgi:hypothetical protein